MFFIFSGLLYTDFGAECWVGLVNLAGCLVCWGGASVARYWGGHHRHLRGGQTKAVVVVELIGRGAVPELPVGTGLLHSGA